MIMDPGTHASDASTATLSTELTRQLLRVAQREAQYWATREPAFSDLWRWMAIRIILSGAVQICISIKPCEQARQPANSLNNNTL